MTERIEFRPVTENDLDLLVAWLADPQTIPGWNDSPKSRQEIYEECIAPDGSRDGFIVLIDAAPGGYVQSWSDEPPDGGIDVFLVPRAQGRGIGPAVVRSLAVRLRAAGWRRITLDPRADNIRAIRAFEKAGFVRTELRGDYVILDFPDETS